MTASWAGPLGTVCPLLRPSWLAADPRMTASTRSPSRSASRRRFSTRTPHPSPRTKPSASSSNERQAPDADSIPQRENEIEASGVSMRFTPPATATRASPVRRACRARWIAVRLDEQAVSTARLGPSRPR